MTWTVGQGSTLAIIKTNNTVSDKVMMSVNVNNPICIYGDPFLK